MKNVWLFFQNQNRWYFKILMNQTFWANVYNIWKIEAQRPTIVEITGRNFEFWIVLL